MPQLVAMLTVKDLATMFKAPERTVRSWAEQQKIAAIKLRGHWHFFREQAMEFYGKRQKSRQMSLFSKTQSSPSAAAPPKKPQAHAPVLRRQ